MADNTMVEKVKLALRISHNYLDDEIADTIEVAKNEMIRSGVDSDVAHNEDDELVQMAIKTYCLSAYSPIESTRNGYKESWLFQLDNLRKTPIYTGVAHGI